MNNIKLKLIVLMSFLGMVSANHLCALPEKKCNTKKECQMTPTCGGSFRVQCTIKHCATDQTACDYYLDLRKSLLAFSEIKKFNLLMRSVKLCPIVHMHTFQSNEFCYRKKVCQVKQKMKFGTDKVDTISRVKCSCTGAYNETCGSDHCTTSRFKCAGLARVKQNEVKECPHGGQISHAKSIKYYSIFT